MRKVDINGFECDDSFYPLIDLVLTIKGFDLQAIRERYVESRKNRSGKAGSVERREVGLGGIVSLSLSKGQVVNDRVIKKINEPRAIDLSSSGELLAIGAENRVYLIDNSGVRKIDDPWFSYIHTVDLSEDLQHILVSSSGYECLVEFDLTTLKKSFEWFAWENGFNKRKKLHSLSKRILNNFSSEFLKIFTRVFISIEC